MGKDSKIACAVCADETDERCEHCGRSICVTHAEVWLDATVCDGCASALRAPEPCPACSGTGDGEADNTVFCQTCYGSGRTQKQPASDPKEPK